MATILNVNRGKDSEWVSPFDFLPGFERDPQEVEAEKQRKDVIREIRRTFIDMPKATPEQVKQERDRIIARLTERGYEDPEGMMREAFPNL